MTAKDRIIVALDVDSPDKAIALVEKLAPHVGAFKIGLEFITAMIVTIVTAPGLGAAVDAVVKIRKLFELLAGKLFWDGKFNDIANTIAKASKVLSTLGLKMFNVHASSGVDGMTAATQNAGSSLPLAVTVLTSLEENDAHNIFGAPSKAKVLQFAREAKLAGIGGIICSPRELELFDKHPELAGFPKATPGIRSPEDPSDDQKRTMTPREAIRAGAHWLVIGRPITNAADPVAAVQKIAAEISAGLRERLHLALLNLSKVKFGAFKLKLHETNPTAPLSPIYLDIRNLPDWVYALAGDVLHDLALSDGIIDFDYVIGIPKAGEPIGKAFAAAIGKPFLRIEKIEESGGRRISANTLDPFEKGRRVVLIDDLVTRAHTKREAIEAVEANGLQVVETLVLYDREQGGLAELNEGGRKTTAASKLSGMLDFFVGQKKITAEKRDEVMAYIAAN